MEDSAKVHLGAATMVRERVRIQGFDRRWPASSQDLNPIEKVWRWMKARITELEPFPITKEELKKVV